MECFNFLMMGVKIGIDRRVKGSRSQQVRHASRKLDCPTTLNAAKAANDNTPFEAMKIAA